MKDSQARKDIEGLIERTSTWRRERDFYFDDVNERIARILDFLGIEEVVHPEETVLKNKRPPKNPSPKSEERT